jgi:hypothetical protein
MRSPEALLFQPGDCIAAEPSILGSSFPAAAAGFVLIRQHLDDGGVGVIPDETKTVVAEHCIGEFLGQIHAEQGVDLLPAYSHAGGAWALKGIDKVMAVLISQDPKPCLRCRQNIQAGFRSDEYTRGTYPSADPSHRPFDPDRDGGAPAV